MNNITVDPDQAVEIVRDAYLYGWPLSENYNTLNSYALVPGTDNFKAPLNEICNESEVYGPDDTTVVSPNSDTPYSFVWGDLRAEPLVFTVPPIAFDGPDGRYYSFQLIDVYTHNFHYIGKQHDDFDGGNFVIVGPRHEGSVESLENDGRFRRVIRCDTDFFFTVVRTQLFDPDDMVNVTTIQEQYKVQTLSQFNGASDSPTAQDPDWPEPKAGEAGETPEVFEVINFMLNFCRPAHPDEEEMMARFAKIGVGPGLPFDASELSGTMLDAFNEGIRQAWAAFGQVQEAGISTTEMFGTREFLKSTGNHYLYRFAGAKIGIYGNSKEEAYYPMYYNDVNDAELDGLNQRYTLTVPATGLPAEAFASITMYDLEEQLLVANSIDRYLVNTPMLDSFVKNNDGSVTIYIQHEEPQDGIPTSNWLPAPAEPFFMAMRLYVPDWQRIEDEDWVQPPVIPV